MKAKPAKRTIKKSVVKKTTTKKQIKPTINNLKVATIVRAIDRWINKNDVVINYSKWYCGISKHSDDTRKKQREYAVKIKTIYFKIWDAGNMPTANAVEKIMSEKGMINAPHSGGATKQSNHVYVYKQKKSILDHLGLFIDSLS